MTICFDLGGVLVRVRRTWGECAAASGLRVPSTFEKVAVGDDPLLVAYQGDELSSQEYLDQLAERMQITPDEAKSLHAAILAGCYDGAAELVERLKSDGLESGCLSNTNELHWETMASQPEYRAVQSLDYRVASFEIGVNKPDPQSFRWFEEISDSTDVFFFEDNAENLAAAQIWGWQGALIDPDQDSVPQIKAALARARSPK